MSSKAQRRGGDYRRKRKRFHANQYTRNASDTLAVDCISASAKKLCKENYLDKEILYGLVSEFYVECYSCSTLTTFKSSSVIASSKDYEVNTRITYAMRTVGLGFCGIKNFCTAMDLPSPVSQNVIGDVTGKVIDVAVLSSYCKGCEKWRGPKSGHSYEEWKLKHQPHCVKNHIGSSIKMEVDGMKFTDEEPMHHFCPIGDRYFVVQISKGSCYE
ncbi:uncharacterized protein TNCV_468081 [Trichonephila clavipes]|nr:uncharacterized protein TNCV_468081 [Trichonephila clavipes]